MVRVDAPFMVAIMQNEKAVWDFSIPKAVSYAVGALVTALIAEPRKTVVVAFSAPVPPPARIGFHNSSQKVLFGDNHVRLSPAVPSTRMRSANVAKSHR